MVSRGSSNTPRGIGRGINAFPQDGRIAAYVPQEASDFQSLRLAVPNYLWLCQDATAQLANTIGGLDLTTVGAGTPLLRQPVLGWNRTGVGVSADGDAVGFRATGTNGPRPAVGSVAWFGLFRFPSTPGANRTFLSMSTSAVCSALIRATGVLRITVNANTADGTYNYLDGSTHPIILSYNKTTSTVAIYTDKETIPGTWDATVGDTNKGIGGVAGGATAVWRCQWLAAYSGANAEQDWKAYLASLRWPLAY